MSGVRLEFSFNDKSLRDELRRKVTIKARPYLGFSDDDMNLIEEEVAAFLSGD